MKIVRVISGKAGLRLASCLVPAKEDDYSYWFDETGSVESPVKSTTAYKKEWFETVAEVDLIEQGINDNANAAKKANEAAAQAQATADKALKAANENTGSAYFASFVWEEETDYTFRDIFKMTGYQSIMPLNGYVLLWTRQDPTAKTMSNRISKTDTPFGISKSTWDESILVNMEDITKPTVRVITVGTGDGKVTVFVESIEVANAVQK